MLNKISFEYVMNTLQQGGIQCHMGSQNFVHVIILHKLDDRCHKFLISQAR